MEGTEPSAEENMIQLAPAAENPPQAAHEYVT
jgi:hypothetical protein